MQAQEYKCLTHIATHTHSINTSHTHTYTLSHTPTYLIPCTLSYVVAIIATIKLNRTITATATYAVYRILAYTRVVLPRESKT
jgi:hypothetical protein